MERRQIWPIPLTMPDNEPDNEPTADGWNAALATQLARLSEGWCPMKNCGRLDPDRCCPSCGWQFRADGEGWYAVYPPDPIHSETRRFTS